jgi:hypothetical protein
LLNSFAYYMPNARNARSKGWCFTLNQFLPDEVLALRSFARGSSCTYMVFGREVGESGTRHLQGYLHLANRQRLSWLKNRVSQRAHFEIRRGTVLEASQYCKKDGDFEEFGTAPTVTQGERTDLEKIKEEIRQGATELEIAENHFSKWVIYRRSFDRYRSLLQQPRDFASEVYVYWGDTGTGKTRKVFESEPDLWIAPDNQLQWFDGYHGQEAVLFDDFVSVKNTRFGFLLQLLDRYPLQVPVKGGFVNWRPRRIYFTSNLAPGEWYTGANEQQLAALRRRFNEVLHFSRAMNHN